MKRCSGVAVLLALGACHSGMRDWRASVTADAESQIRQLSGDPAATFSREQVTGDDRTGQTCGYVTAKVATDAGRRTGRFIVYIDRNPGPLLEEGLGDEALGEEDFMRNWTADCLGEGYHS